MCITWAIHVFFDEFFSGTSTQFFSNHWEDIPKKAPGFYFSSTSYASVIFPPGEKTPVPLGFYYFSDFFFGKASTFFPLCMKYPGIKYTGKRASSTGCHSRSGTTNVPCIRNILHIFCPSGKILSFNPRIISKHWELHSKCNNHLNLMRFLRIFVSC